MEKEDLWEDGLNSNLVCEHYGYEDIKDGTIGQGFWRKDIAQEWFKKMSETLQLDWERKIQVIFEYDPDYPRAYLRVIGQKDVNLQ